MKTGFQISKLERSDSFALSLSPHSYRSFTTRDICCRPFQIRKKAGQQPDQREKRADPVHIFDAGAISQLAKDRRSNAGDSKSQSKEKSRYQSDFTRN